MAAVLFAALAAFGGGIGAGFYLDDLALFQDAAITSPDGWLDCLHLRQTRPLTWLSFRANYQAAGEHAASFHAVNLALHLACVWAAFAALRRMIPERAAWIAAGLFALHPIQTEAVVYVFARATLWMTLGCLLSLRYWMEGRRWVAVAWFAFALAGKEECAAFPVLLLLLHVCGKRDRAERPALGAMFALAVAAGVRVFAVAAMTAGSGAGLQAGVTPAAYFVAQGFALWRYARLLVLPYGFSIDSPLTPEPAWLGIGGWVVIAAVAAWCLRRAGRLREGFWVVAALVLIAPSSSILPAQDLAADRRVYFPLLALGAALGLWLMDKPRWVAVALGAALTLVSVRQTMVWRSGESLWREAVRLAPEKTRPRIQLARQLPPGEALAVLREAEKLTPDNPAIASEQGRVLLQTGNAGAALAAFGKALALDPDDPRAMNNRGVALSRLGQRDVAVGDFRRALQRDPCLFDALLNLRNLGERDAIPGQCRFSARQRELLGQP